ncbi:SAM-dependent methyltransferase [Nonomuraea sp. NBC_01738]|uniref:SAM-dependent methyltransferase n=1 Tax=Nonomuraea sp. NBC_01738 TaxID=2976003 RepID=UPI002E12A03D|nr:SAM-dependent methyltransferase [Nonomuraea sp. NBC_01738]
MDLRGSTGFDPNTPNAARLYDYFLGGKDHFPADRLAAEDLLRVAPEVRRAARANRAFLGRAVRHLRDLGIEQFLDIGTGLPAQGAVHELAGPLARVTYVDNDPVVLVHARAMLARSFRTTVVAGDVRQPHEILKNRDLGIDFDRPVAILLVAVLHFVAEADDPERIVAALRDIMAPGSHLVISHAAAEARAAAVARGVEIYDRSHTPITPRSRKAIEALFAGFDLVDPGLVWLPEWRPEQADHIDFPRDPGSSLQFGGIGRKR